MLCFVTFLNLIYVQFKHLRYAINMTEAILHSCSFLQECQFLARRMCLILTGLFCKTSCKLPCKISYNMQDMVQLARQVNHLLSTCKMNLYIFLQIKCKTCMKVAKSLAFLRCLARAVQDYVISCMISTCKILEERAALFYLGWQLYIHTTVMHRNNDPDWLISN